MTLELIFLSNGLIIGALTLLLVAKANEKRGRKWTLGQDLKRKERGRNYEKKLENIQQMGFRLNLIQRLEKKYLFRSGLSSKFPWLTLNGLFIGSLTSAIIGSIWIWTLFKIEGLVVSGALVGMVLPFHVIALYGAWRNRRLINNLPGFYGVLQRWALIQEDVYFCLGQLENSGIDESLRSPFTLFVLESNAGLSKGDAFFNLEQRFQGTPVLHFVRCLERMTEQRGDLVKMLQGFENESYQLQTEMSERQDTQIKYNLLINGLSIASFFLIYMLLNTNRVLSDFYIETLLGKSLLSGLSLLMALSFIGGLKYERL